MIRIEVSVSGWQKEKAERMLRFAILDAVKELGTLYPSLEVNRIQFSKPRSK